MDQSPSTDTAVYRQSRSDQIGIWIFIVAGAVIAVWSVWGATVRIGEVLSNRDVSVLGEFAGTPATAPIGPAGTDVPVELDRAALITPELPGIAVATIVAQQVLLAVAIVTVVLCLLLLARSILRGRVFSRGNTALVTTAGLTGLIGAAAVPFLGNIAANAAFAQISDGDFDNVVMAVDVFPFLLAAFVVAIASTAFTVGERLRRDTAGLV